MGWYKRGRVRSTGPVEFQVHTLQLSCDLSIPTMNFYCLEPCEENQFLADHVALLLASLQRWTGRDLVDPELPIAEQARRIFYAPFAVLSHDTAADPILNYGNRVGMELFELTWEELSQMASRLTAEAVHRQERTRLLHAVTRHGFIDDYRGVRISKTGRRFLIENATVWNLLDENGSHYGQAATFNAWKYLDAEGT